MTTIRKRTVAPSQESSCGCVNNNSHHFMFVCHAVQLAVRFLCFFAVTQGVHHCLEAWSVLLITLKRALGTNKQGRRMLTTAEPIAMPTALPGGPVLPVALVLCLIRMDWIITHCLLICCRHTLQSPMFQSPAAANRAQQQEWRRRQRAAHTADQAAAEQAANSASRRQARQQLQF